MTYDFIEDYTMKCRLYPNKKQREQIDRILIGVRIAYNCSLYAVLNDPAASKQDDKPNENGEYPHYPNFGYLTAKEWKAKITEENPIVKEVPAYAITGNAGCIKYDLARALSAPRKKDGKHVVMPVERTKQMIELKKHLRKRIRDLRSRGADQKVIDALKEEMKGLRAPSYYNSEKPRMSYTYQEPCSKFFTKSNRNAMYARLARLSDCGDEGKESTCKIKGWNQEIRFDPEGKMQFPEWLQENKSKQITITISKDNCDSYYICFKLHNAVYKPMSKKVGKEVGIKMGAKDLVTLSDNEKFQNKRFKEQEQRHKRRVSRRLSRRWGWANEQFRAAHVQDKTIRPSKTYERTRLKLAKLERKIARRRANENHIISRKIVQENGRIGIETLDVVKKFQSKHTARVLADSAISTILDNIRYKAKWHGREVVAVDEWFPSVKTCHTCGHIMERKSIVPRYWRCPKCKTVHDKDVNAAINILHAAFYPSLIAG